MMEQITGISVDYLDVDTEGYTLPNITEDTKANVK